MVSVLNVNVSEPKKSLTGAPDKGKDKGSKGKAAEVALVEESPQPPPPLEVQVCLRLHHWATARDCTLVLEGEEEEGEGRSGEDESQVPSVPPQHPTKKAK